MTLKDEKVSLTIRAKDKEIEQAEALVVNLEFLTDEVPQFDSEPNPKPLTCSDADQEWTFDVPKVKHS